MAGFGGGGETYEIAGEEENLCLLFVEPRKERVAQIRTHGADGGTLFKRPDTCPDIKGIKTR